MQDQLSTRVAVRDAKREDVPQLVALINALNLHEGTAETMTQAHAEYILFNPARSVAMQCRVAVSGTNIVGFVLFYRGYDTASTSFGLHIADIFIASEHRQLGIGAMLMGDVAKHCLDGGGEWCSLTVLEKNHEAHHFYDALGFARPEVAFRSIGPKGLKALST